MKNYLGIRIKPNAVVLAVIKEDNKREVLFFSIVLSKTKTLAENLVAFKQKLIELINQQNIYAAVIKTSEPNARKVSTERMYFEGVAMASVFEEISKCESFSSIQMSKLLNVKTADFKNYLKDNGDLNLFDKWNSFNSEEKEAAAGALTAST